MRSLLFVAAIVLNINVIMADVAVDTTSKVDQKLRELVWNTKEATTLKKNVSILLKNRPTNELANVTIFMVAAAVGDLDAVKLLVDCNEKASFQEKSQKYTIPKDQSPELDSLRNLLGSTFEPLLANYLDIRMNLGRYIRAETDCGYTALTYAVVGGWENIVKYLIEEIKNKTGIELLQKEINKEDCKGWTSILYAASYKEDAPVEKNKAMSEIFTLLVQNGGDIKIKVGFEEARPLDIASIAAKYNHPQIIDSLRMLYAAIKKSCDYLEAKRTCKSTEYAKRLMFDTFGSISQIERNISNALVIARSSGHKEAEAALIKWQSQL